MAGLLDAQGRCRLIQNENASAKMHGARNCQRLTLPARSALAALAPRTALAARIN